MREERIMVLSGMEAEVKSRGAGYLSGEHKKWRGYSGKNGK